MNSEKERTDASDPKFSVRPYFPSDRENIRALCCETGFFGKPIEHIFRDKKWFADLNTKYYLKFEPDSCFIAESDGQLIGYVLGCRRPRQYGFLFYTTIAIPLFIQGLFKALSGIYDNKSRMYILGLVFKASRQRPKRKKRASHLHMNIREGWRSLGVGRALGKALVDFFDRHNVQWICGETFHSDRKRAMSFYQPWGFRIYDKKKTTLFGGRMGKIYLISVIGNLRDPKTREKWGL